MQQTDAPAPPASVPDAATVEAWMVQYITSVIDVPGDPFPLASRFDTYGLDSVELTIMAGMIEERFSLVVTPEELFENPSVAAFSAHLAGRLARSETGAPAAVATATGEG